MPDFRKQREGAKERPEIVLTYPRSKVIRGFIGHPDDERHGVEIYRAAGSSPGTIYPLLEFMKAKGWLIDRWETDEEAKARTLRSKPRRYWRAVKSKLPEMMAFIKQWDDREQGKSRAR